jgi:hypothetical protein
MWEVALFGQMNVHGHASFRLAVELAITDQIRFSRPMARKGGDEYG